MNRGRWFIVTFCLAVLCALAAPSAMMADEWDKVPNLHLVNPSRYQAKFFQLERIGSPSRTASQIAISFRSGTRIGRGW